VCVCVCVCVFVLLSEDVNYVADYVGMIFIHIMFQRWYALRSGYLHYEV